MLKSLVVVATLVVFAGCASAKTAPKNDSAMTQAPASVAAALPLDGQTFVVSHHGKAMADTLSFSNGKFMSSHWDKKGFGEADYTATPMGKKGFKFEATLMNADGSKIAWTGKVIGHHLFAKAELWKKGAKHAKKMMFHGKLEKKTASE